MERLWAPWRLPFILEGSHEEGCLFCKRHAGGVRRDDLVVYADERGVVLLNKYPYTGGHLMVAPAEHAGRPDELSPAAWQAAAELLQQTCVVVLEVMRPDGINLGMNVGRAAGAGIPGHLHWHVVPRWEGDANFMPAVAGVKVIPELLGDTWDRLRPAFAAIEEAVGKGGGERS